MNTGKHKIKDNITEKDRNLCSLANCLIVYCKESNGLSI